MAHHSLSPAATPTSGPIPRYGPCDPAAFRAALDVAVRINEACDSSGRAAVAHVAQELHVPPTLVTALRAGRAKPRYGSALPYRLARFLCWWLEDDEPGSFAAEIRERAPALVPEAEAAARALGATYAAARRDHAWDRERGESGYVGRYKMLGAGVHLAPFLSPAGRAMLAVIGPTGALGGLVELTAVAPVADTHRHTDPRTGTVRTLGAARWLTDPDHVPNTLTWTGTALLPAGVHYAPWRILEAGERGRCLVAVDDRGRLVARMDVTSGDVGELLEARRDLETLLEVVAGAPDLTEARAEDAGDALAEDAGGYRDGYGVDEDDSPDDFGDEWKRGA